MQLFKSNQNQWSSQFGTTQFGNSEFDSLPDQNQTFGQPTNGLNQQPTDFSRLENAIEVLTLIKYVHNMYGCSEIKFIDNPRLSGFEISSDETLIFQN